MVLVAFMVPVGFSDRYGEELRRQRDVERVFRDVGYRQGFGEILTPVIEPLDALPQEFFSAWDERMIFSFVLSDYDSTGAQIGSRTVALRPEGTMPVCRYLATRLKQGNLELPQRLMYSIACYRNEPVDDLDSLKMREFNQLGVEIIGDDSLQADAAGIRFAYETLKETGVAPEDIRIRVNDIVSFRGLCDAAGLSSERRVSVQQVLDAYSKDRAVSDDAIVPDCPSSFSPVLAGYLGDAAVIEYSRPLAGLCELLGDVPLACDGAVVRGFNYYTGIVYQIDIRVNGEWIPEVGGGGRYDGLIGKNLRQFGIDRDIPATGFAFGTERLVSVTR